LRNPELFTCGRDSDPNEMLKTIRLEYFTQFAFQLLRLDGFDMVDTPF